jgi:hypothetical protein
MKASLSLLVLLILAGCGSKGTIQLSTGKITDRGIVTLTGRAFPPKSIVHSHLKRPDGTEFPPLRFLTDEKGEFTHKIDTFTLQAGMHQAWIVDGRGKMSNVVAFEVVEEKQ